MITETKNKIIEIKPGTSLEDISKEDILIYDGTQELVEKIDETSIVTLRRMPKGYQSSFERITRIREENYCQELGMFTSMDIKVIPSYDASYKTIDNKMKGRKL